MGGDCIINYPFDCITDFIFAEDFVELSDVILVPGGSHPQLAARAAELYRQGMAGIILISGGHNPKIPDQPSEAAFLKQTAIRAGVPEDRILCEEKATNTFENALFSHDILKLHNISPRKIILVCKAFHARRALLTYQKTFPKDTRFLVSPVTDNNGITKNNWFTDQAYIDKVMLEVEKIGIYFRDTILEMYRG